MLIYGHAGLIRWAEDRLGTSLCRPAEAIGVARDGAIVAVAVFHNFRPPAIEISFASTTPRWASKEHIRGILGYPFRQLDCKRITAITEAGNTAARTFMERLGFTREGIHPDALPTGDAVTYGLLRRDCRWLEE